MKGSKLCWLLAELILLAVWILSGDGRLLALPLCLILLPLLSFVGDLAIRKRIRVSLKAEPNLQKNGVGRVILEAENPTWLPVFALRCPLRVENVLMGTVDTLEVTLCLLPRRKGQRELELSSRWCGRLRIGTGRVRLYDCFGLIPVGAACSGSAALTVQPDTFEQTVHISADANCPDDSEVYSQERPGYDLTETFQIRDYQIGDSIRQVHWKLSSKFDRLIIRDPSLPVTRSVVVFWERSGQQADRPDLTDAQAEAVVTVCRTLVSQSVQFTVAWNDVERDVCVMQEIRDMDDLIGLLPKLLGARGKAEGACGGQLFAQGCGEVTYSHILYIAGARSPQAEELCRLGRVTMLICGSDGDFDPEHFREQLMELEI